MPDVLVENRPRLTVPVPVSVPRLRGEEPLVVPLCDDDERDEKRRRVSLFAFHFRIFVRFCTGEEVSDDALSVLYCRWGCTDLG